MTSPLLFHPHPHDHDHDPSHAPAC
jgi:hypothetical protein